MRNNSNERKCLKDTTLKRKKKELADDGAFSASLIYFESLLVRHD